MSADSRPGYGVMLVVALDGHAAAHLLAAIRGHRVDELAVTLQQEALPLSDDPAQVLPSTVTPHVGIFFHLCDASGKNVLVKAVS